MGLTSNQLPYPEQTDSVDVVRDVKALADALNPRVPPDTFTVFTVNPAFTVSENNLSRRFGWWHLHLVLLNATAGTFGVGTIPLGTIPAGARGSTDAGSANMGSAYVTPSGSSIPIVWPAQATWSDGSLTVFNGVALASQPVGGLLIRTDLHWPQG